MSRIARLYRCSRHVPMTQLARRVQLMLKRRFVVSRFGSLFRRRRNGQLPMADRLPQAVFAPRLELVQERNGAWSLCQLNRSFSLDSPVDWMLDNTPHTHLERLAMHYHEFLEAVPPDVGQRLILDWIDANPPWMSGYWLDRWNSYAISIRCVCWMQWISGYRDRLEISVLQKIVGSLVEQIRFLKSNLETDICGNHLIRNIRCLMWAGRFFEGAEADAWMELGTSLLKVQVREQFLGDGVHFELSPAYHCQVFADLVDCAAVADEQIRCELIELLAQPASALAHLTHPDGKISLMSDGGLQMAYSPRECLEGYVRVGGRPPIVHRTFSGKQSGYYVCRGERTFLVADCGAACDDVLAAHGHADILAFEWDVDGKRIVVDAGVYQYEAGAERLKFRSVISHNTVQVGSRDQVELVGSFRTGRRAYGVCDAFGDIDGRFELRGHHDGFSLPGETIIHRRTFVASGATLVVRDVVELDASVETVAESVVSRLLLHHDCETVEIDERNIMIRSGAAIIRLNSTVPMRIVAAVWSPDFGVLIPTKRIELQCGVVPCSAEFTLTVEA